MTDQPVSMTSTQMNLLSTLLINMERQVVGGCKYYDFFVEKTTIEQEPVFNVVVRISSEISAFTLGVPNKDFIIGATCIEYDYDSGNRISVDDQRWILLSQLYSVLSEIISNEVKIFRMEKMHGWNVITCNDATEDATEYVIADYYFYDDAFNLEYLINSGETKYKKYSQLLMELPAHVRFITYPDGMQRNMKLPCGNDLHTDITAMETYFREQDDDNPKQMIVVPDLGVWIIPPTK